MGVNNMATWLNAGLLIMLNIDVVTCYKHICKQYK